MDEQRTIEVHGHARAFRLLGAGPTVLLLLHGMEKAGMSEKDVTLVNAKTNETPQVLGSGQVDAIGAWQPRSAWSSCASGAPKSAMMPSP